MTEKRERDPCTGRYIKAGSNDRFDVAVWDMRTGDHVKQLWDATQEEVERVEEQYRDEPGFEVVVEARQ